MNPPEIEHPLIIGHRGYSAKYPENTLAAFQGALDAGVKMIELDVTLTRDRKLIVIHDDTLERTTNGRGPVSDYRLDELKELDAGSWFDPRFADERIPTLEEVIDLIEGCIRINIEIKSSAYEAHQPPDAIEKQVLELVRGKTAKDSVLISSFEWKILENIRRTGDAPAIGLLSQHAADMSSVKNCKRLKAFSWNASQRKLDRQQVAMMHDAGVRVYAYTVNSRDLLKKLLAMGVDGVFSDDPLLNQP